MLANFIPTLVQELELGNTTLSSGVPGIYSLPLEEGLSINMSEIPSGFIFKANVAPFPMAQEELFVTRTMLANLYGQGTRGAILGLSPEGNTLTLTLVIDFPVDYKGFREHLEDFLNTVDFWRAEALAIKS